MILTEHLEECGEEAVAVLTEGQCWPDAYRLATRLGRMDLYETHLKPSIIEAAENISNNIRNTTIKFNSQVVNKIYHIMLGVNSDSKFFPSSVSNLCPKHSSIFFIG